MMVRRLGVILGTILLFGCALIATGCDSGATSAATSISGSPQLFPVLVDGKWGYIDNTGTIKIEPRFGYADSFSEGLAVVGTGVHEFDKMGPYGYIDTSGTIVIEPRFTQAADFSEGLAGVAVLQGGVNKRGYIDTTGTIVIPLEHADGYSFSEGLGRVCGADQSSYRFVDKTGETVLGPYSFAADFSEGLAWVEVGAKRGFIDRNGDWVAGPASGSASDFDFHLGFSQGLAAAQTLATPPVFGYVDKTGAWVVEPRFGYADSFSEGLAVVGTGVHEFDKMGPYGYIDTSGAMVIAAQYDGARAFSEGLAMVYVGGKCGYIDTTGTMVIPARYLGVDDFSGGLAEVRVTGHESGPSYIDKTGKVIWQGE